MTALALILFSLQPSLAEPATDHVDALELNSFYDESGRLVFDQVIFWHWHADGLHVQAWRLVKEPNQLPARDRNGEWYVLWFDGDRSRLVRSDSYLRTWTQTDRELDDRDWWPKCRRAGIGNTPEAGP